MKEDKEELVEFITNEGLVRINLNKIYYFEYQSRKVLMKTNDKIYILKEKISDISSRMRSHGFEMPHKSFVVNLYNVKSIKGYDIFMMDESVIPLSQKKSTEFRKTLNIYLSNHIEKNVNLYNVKSIKGYDIFMMDESVIPLSQKKSTEFRKTLNIYLSNHIEKNIRG